MDRRIQALRLLHLRGAQAIRLAVAALALQLGGIEAALRRIVEKSVCERMRATAVLQHRAIEQRERVRRQQRVGLPRGKHRAPKKALHQLAVVHARRSGIHAVIIIREIFNLPHRLDAAAAAEVRILRAPAVVRLNDFLRGNGHRMDRQMGPVAQRFRVRRPVKEFAGFARAAPFVAGIAIDRGEPARGGRRQFAVVDETAEPALAGTEQTIVPVQRQPDLDAKLALGRRADRRHDAANRRTGHRDGAVDILETALGRHDLRKFDSRVLDMRLLKPAALLDLPRIVVGAGTRRSAVPCQAGDDPRP
ncbi:hypothetical protein WM25_09095 [Burkholderia ubonensis]|nr:hypothetical protein WM25_09095 [Burkholderia ubonensis]